MFSLLVVISVSGMSQIFRIFRRFLEFSLTMVYLE